MTTQIGLRISNKILKMIDNEVKGFPFIPNRTVYIKRAIEEKLLRDERRRELKLIEEKKE